MRNNSLPNRLLRRQHGQVLVLVALGLVALLLFVALAVDVGFWYSQRRYMQNAADSGALAGAWEICFGNPDSAESAAQDYAQRNGATEVDVDVREDGTVVVTARQPAETFFVGMAGYTPPPISAVAAAACAAAESGCGMWPVAFDQASYSNEALTGACNGPAEYDPDFRYDLLTTDPSAPEEYRIKENSQFILWAGDNQDFDPEAIDEHCWFASGDYRIASVQGGSPMDPGNRGWVALRLLKGFTVPEDSAWAECKSADNCGASALNCWLQHGYIGSIAIGDCLATEDGTIDNSLNYAKLKEGQLVSVVIYDHPNPYGGADCDPSSNPNTCNGSKAYHVADYGCVRVEHVFDGSNCPEGCYGDRDKDYLEWYHRLGYDPVYTAHAMLPVEEGGYGCTEKNGKWTCEDTTPTDFSCPSPATGIVVTKICACPPTLCTGTTGGGSGTMNAVSLVPVPSAP